MQESKRNIEDLERYISKHGNKKAARLLSALGKDHQFISAWESAVGQEIMSHLLIITDEALDKIISEEADEKIRAEFRVCMALLKYMKDRINNYQRNLHELKNEE